MSTRTVEVPNEVWEKFSAAHPEVTREQLCDWIAVFGVSEEADAASPTRRTMPVSYRVNVPGEYYLVPGPSGVLWSETNDGGSKPLKDYESAVKNLIDLVDSEDYTNYDGLLIEHTDELQALRDIYDDNDYRKTWNAIRSMQRAGSTRDEIKEHLMKYSEHTNSKALNEYFNDDPHESGFKESGTLMMATDMGHDNYTPKKLEEM